MTFDDSLKEKLKSLFDYNLTLDEEKAIELGQIKQLLHKKIISNKFAKNNLTDATKSLIYKKISESVDKNEPLFFLFCFGGYKNHWVKEHHPNIDWAEVFNLMYVAKLLSPIAKAYKPGIIYEFEAEDGAVVEEDNYLKSDVDAYAKSFKSLITWLNRNYMPSNFKFSYTRLDDHYDSPKLFKDIRPLIDLKIKELKKLPTHELEKELKRVKFNFKIKGRIDCSFLSEAELTDKYVESLAINKVFLDEDFKKRSDYFIGGNHIPLVGAYCSDEENVDNWITINSVGSRDNSFWTSKGIAVKAGDTYRFDVLSPSNYEAIKDKLDIEMSSVLSDIVPNLNSIPVINK